MQGHITYEKKDQDFVIVIFYCYSLYSVFLIKKKPPESEELTVVSVPGTVKEC